MGRKVRSLTLAVGLVIGAGAAFAAPVGAVAPPPINGVGTLSCAVKATLTFNPPLVIGGTAPRTSTLKSNIGPCTGTGDGANIKKGVSTVVTNVANSDCLKLKDPPSGDPTPGSIKWTVLPHTPKQVNSTIQFTSSSQSDGPPITQDATGTSTAGSYSGQVASSHAVIKETYAQIFKKCSATVQSKGLKTLHIIVPGSTFTLTNP